MSRERLSPGMYCTSYSNSDMEVTQPAKRELLMTLLRGSWVNAE